MGKTEKLYLISLAISLLFSFCKKEKGNDEEFKKAVDSFKKDKSDRIGTPQKSVLPFIAGRSMDPVWDINDPEIITIPKFSFKNQKGATVTEKSLDGKITAVCFFYARCRGFCPVIMRNMNRIREKTGAALHMASFSVTPEFDTPEVLEKYSSSTGYGRENWDLLTGEKEKIYSIARNIFNADTDTFEKKSKDDFIHSEQIYIIDSKRRLRGVYNGNAEGDIEKIVEDIRKTFQEINK